MGEVANGYDVIGNVVIVKFVRGARSAGKKKWALGFLKTHKSVRTVLEKSAGFSGRLRKLKTKHIAGEKTKEVLYRENGCVFRLNVDDCYFSPRLSTERSELASKVKKGERVLVMFGGVAPFAIVIAQNSGVGEVVSVELSRACNRYAKDNVKRNKLAGRVDIVQGDVRRVLGKKVNGKIGRGKIGHKSLVAVSGLFDRIVMARPQLKDSFLDVAFPVVKKGGVIHYYGFYKEEEVGELKGLIEEEARGAGRKIKIQRVKKAGEVGVKRWRWRVDFKVLN